MDIFGVPPALGLLSQFGSNAPTLVPGQVIEAVVLALLEDGSARLALPGGATLDVHSTIPLTTGVPVRFVVKSTGSGLQLVALPEDPARSSAAPAASEGSAQIPNVVASSSDGAPETTPSEGQAVNQAVNTAIQGANSTTQVAVGDRPAAPQANGVDAVVNAVRNAAARQGGLAPLMADVEQLLSGDATEVPAAVLKAAAQLLAFRLPLQNGLTAADIKQALSQSGLFLEARLAPPNSEPVEGSAVPTGRPGTAVATANPPAGSNPTASRPSATNAPLNPPDLASPVADLKTALLVLRQVVKLWANQASAAPSATATAEASDSPKTLPIAAAEEESGAATPPVSVPSEATTLLPPPPSSPYPEPPPSAQSPAAPPSLPPSAPSAPSGSSTLPLAPPPPYRGSPPVAQPATAATLAPGSAPADAAQRLLGETDAALARHTLFQAASLPDRPTADTPRVQTQGPQWAFEVPLMTPAGTSIAQFEIARDGRAATADGHAIWRVRFSVDVEPMGPVHAQVTLLGNRAAVTLWAERPHSAAQLRDSSPLLVDALKQAELEPGDILCRAGAPVVPRASAPPAGQFLDRAS